MPPPEPLAKRVTDQILTAMAQQGVSRSDLARKMNRSNPYITQLLSGERNMTMSTLESIAAALNRVPVIVLAENTNVHLSDPQDVTSEEDDQELLR